MVWVSGSELLEAERLPGRAAARLRGRATRRVPADRAIPRGLPAQADHQGRVGRLALAVRPILRAPRALAVRADLVVLPALMVPLVRAVQLALQALQALRVRPTQARRLVREVQLALPALQVRPVQARPPVRLVQVAPPGPTPVRSGRCRLVGPRLSGRAARAR
jgi:hypothetical protein